MGDLARRSLVDALIHNLRRASFSSHARFRRALSDRGLSMGQFVVLRSLVSSGRGTTKALATALGVTTGNVTGLVDKLESEGLVIRDRSTKDRRVVHLEATRKGRALMEELRRAVVAEAATSFASLTSAELRNLNDLLRRVIDAEPCDC